ncbi:MAG: hypothetical protein HYY48_01340 [Gammaproteobacteria bacterium]|nr:hypothetical protein [Gammaproteobacteria bacterium]
MYGARTCRTLAFAACLTGLGGCAFLPPVIEQSYALLSGISYLATSKGPADHAISLAMERDCAPLRVLLGKPACRPLSDDSNRPLVATLIGVLHAPPADLQPQELFTEFRPPVDLRMSLEPAIAQTY